jgi:hypothetical protein
MTSGRFLRRCVCALALVALAATGCGGGAHTTALPSATPTPVATTQPTPLQLLRASPAKMRASRTAVTGLTVTTTVGSQTLVLDSTGKIDFLRGIGEQDVNLTVGQDSLSMTILQDRRAAYVNLGQDIGPGKSWMKLSASDLSAFGGQDPTTTAALLPGASTARLVGRETVRGTPTTHYRAVVDIPAAQRAATGPTAQLLAQFRRLVTTRTLPYDAWLDADGRATKVVFAMALRPGAATGGKRVRTRVTLEFFGWGEPVEVFFPDPSAVVSGSKYLKRLTG